MNNMKKPKIRFKGFTDDWEQRKLSDEFSDFIVPMRDKPKEFGGNVPWTRIEDIEGKYLNGTLSDQYVTEETVKKMNLKIIPRDSLIVSSSATFGVVAVVTRDLITNQTFIGLVPNEKETLDYWYAYFYSDEARKYMKLQSAGSTIFYISRESFEIMPIAVPSKAEMMKIGACFDNLDNLITLHQRKYEKLQIIKKSMLENCFPKNGEKVPKIRFSGFTGDWEQRKLGELGKARSGIGFPDAEQGGKEGVPFYKVSDMNNVGNEHEMVAANNYVTREQIARKGWKPIDEVPAIFFAKVGAAVLLNRKRLCRFPFLLDNNTMAYSIDGSALDADFAITLFDTIDLTSLVQVGALPSYNSGDVENIDVVIPEMGEQRKIGAYFKRINSLITLHQSELEKLQKIKKSLLERMFV